MMIITTIFHLPVRSCMNESRYLARPGPIKVHINGIAGHIVVRITYLGANFLAFRLKMKLSFKINEKTVWNLEHEAGNQNEYLLLIILIFNNFQDFLIKPTTQQLWNKISRKAMRIADLLQLIKLSR